MPELMMDSVALDHFIAYHDGQLGTFGGLSLHGFLNAPD